MASSLPLILCADIGGTNTRLALFDGTDMRDGSAVSMPNASVAHLYDHLHSYLEQSDTQPDLVALALAGPVNGTQGALTNLAWDITTKGASAACEGADAVLLNDLQAQGHALAHIDPAQEQTLFAGQGFDTTRTQLVIGLGTGLNLAAVHPLPGGGFLVPAAEAGHITFASGDPALDALARQMRTWLDHVSSEDVLAGRGVTNTYKYATGETKAPKEIMALATSGDAGACRATSLMARALGEYASDMALVHLARGGVSLVGGVARALAPFLTADDFETRYLDKGRFSDLVGKIPVRVVTDDYAALTGAAHYALQSR